MASNKGDVELSKTGLNGNGKVLDRQVTRDYEVEE